MKIAQKAVALIKNRETL